MKKIIPLVSVALLALSVAMPVFASDDVEHPKHEHWSFDGMFGTVDKQSAQRGYQVYKEVCAGCHSMKRIAFRNLADIGFSAGEIKTIAASYNVQDGPNDEGEMFERPGLPSDRFVSPFANEKAARASNNGAYPPDLSLIIKARHDGANYVYSLLTGYKNAPADFAVPENKHYNPYFPGKVISMPPPLAEGAVTYGDGTKASVDQMSRDLVNFLQWGAEPEMEARKRMGIKTLIFLAIMTVMFYFAKRRVWENVKH